MLSIFGGREQVFRRISRGAHKLVHTPQLFFKNIFVMAKLIGNSGSKQLSVLRLTRFRELLLSLNYLVLQQDKPEWTRLDIDNSYVQAQLISVNWSTPEHTQTSLAAV